MTESLPDVASVEVIRSQFPALQRHHAGRPVAYFDGPGGTQVPRQVAEAMVEYLCHHNANTHWCYPTSVETDAALAWARQTLGDFLNARPDEVVFGNNMTSLTFHVSRALGRMWGPGDEIVVTELDHHANVDPWKALARERGVTIQTVRMNPEAGVLDMDDLAAKIGSRTRLVAVGAASNALGTVNPVARIGEIAHAAGALYYVDAVHYAAHKLVDVGAFDCDFLVCSAYKFYGPHVGVMYGRMELLQGLDVPKLLPAPNTAPDRIETGTQNHEGIVGAAAAVNFLAGLAPDAGGRRERLAGALEVLHHRGIEQVRRLWEGLGRISEVRLYGQPPDGSRTSTVVFTVRGLPAEEVARRLVDSALFASHGDFYAMTVIEKLGLAPDGLVRIGCACYTTDEEIDRLIEAIQAITR
ncbi:MAG: cysteine desulfurase-like protein [Rhodothermales bacterium]|nr:cysteine desulfurase-like protein [Rhodothermales bacterium]